MENQQQNILPEEQEVCPDVQTEEQEVCPDVQTEEQIPQEKYVPRPLWQLILAWLGVALIVGLLVMQFALMLKGGL